MWSEEEVIRYIQITATTAWQWNSLWPAYSAQTEGHDRMITYIRAHFLNATSKTTRTKKNRKLKIFSKQRATWRTQKSKLNKVTLLLKREYTQIKKSGKFLARTLEYPLALCNEDGEMRDRHRSNFWGFLESNTSLEGMFQNSLSFSMT